MYRKQKFWMNLSDCNWQKKILFDLKFKWMQKRFLPRYKINTKPIVTLTSKMFLSLQKRNRKHIMLIENTKKWQNKNHTSSSSLNPVSRSFINVSLMGCREKKKLFILGLFFSVKIFQKYQFGKIYYSFLLVCFLEIFFCIFFV